MKIWKTSAALLLGAACLVLLWMFGGGAWAAHRERVEERAWAASFGSWEQLLGRHPKTVTNDTARRLERLGQPLGFELKLRSGADSAATAASRDRSESETQRGVRELSHYLTVQLEAAQADVAAPAPDVNAFLAGHASDLEALETELLASAPPIWDFDPTLTWNQNPILDTTASIGIQRVLLAKSLAAAASGDETGALRALEASWRLNQEYRRIANTLCQILALAAARLQAGVLRKIPVDPELWRRRLAEHDYKRSLLDAELLSHWPSAQRTHDLIELEARSGKNPKRLWNRLLAPYQDIVWSQVAAGLRTDYIEIRDARVVRDIPEGGPRKRTVAGILLSLQIPNTHGLFRRVDEFLLDAELTDKILQARQLRLQNGGKWPAAIPGIETTRYPGARWIYTVSPDGVMTLELNQNPYKDRGGFKLPLRFTSS